MGPRRGKGYRCRLSLAKKGQRHWNVGANKCFNRKGDFLGFDQLPSQFGENATIGGRYLHKPPLRVLSLRDGIGSGLVALEKLGIKVDAYFASEISEEALQVQRFHFHDKIINVGDMRLLTDERLKEMGRIDLILAGCPCNDLSRVNPHRKGLKGEGSTAKLLIDFKRILRFFQAEGKLHGYHVFYLCENTANMDTTDKTGITELLDCIPIEVCASCFVPMKRCRLFWNNLMGVGHLPCLPPCVGTLQDFLKPYRNAAVSVMPTITTKATSQMTGDKYPIEEEGSAGYLSLTEEEILFGFPMHYTDTGSLSVTDRRKLLGKAWSVHVIEALLKPLRVMFATFQRM